MTNEEQFAALLSQSCPELFTIYQMSQRGHLDFQELLVVAEKMAIIRTSDDGFGKIFIEMQRKNNGNWLRVRTMQDKILKTLPGEDIFDNLST